MHEYSLINSLIIKAQKIAEDNNSSRVTELHVKIGALAHISGDHFREHFVSGSRGTIMESASIIIEESTDESDENAQSILLERITVE